LGEEEGAGADGEEGTFAFGVFLLEIGEGFDEAERLRFGFEDVVSAATGNDEDVEFGEAGVSFLEVDVGAEAGALVRLCVFGEGDEGGRKGFGLCRWG
jgi:hypothetical protein